MVQPFLNEALEVSVEETPTPEDGLPPECSLVMAPGKGVHEPGDVVAITITNTDDEPLDLPNSALSLQIRNVDTGKVISSRSCIGNNYIRARRIRDF
jgi:hypothetical protein